MNCTSLLQNFCKVLPIAALALSIPLGAQESPKVIKGDAQSQKIKTVFFNVNGPQRMAHRLWTLLDMELEDAGFVTTESERGADAIILADLKPDSAKKDIFAGVIHARFSSHGNTENEVYCRSLSTDENTDLFEKSGTEVAEGLQKNFPLAHTVFLEATSDFETSPSLRINLLDALKRSGFEIMQKMPADVLLFVHLERQRVSIAQDTMAYSVKIASADQVYQSYEGTMAISAKLAEPAPAVCPHRFDDLKWLVSYNSQLSNLAAEIAGSLRGTLPAR